MSSVKFLHSCEEHTVSSKCSSELHNPESIPIKYVFIAVVSAEI